MAFSSFYKKLALFLILLFPILFIKQCDKRANHFFQELPYWPCSDNYPNIECVEGKRKIPNFQFVNHNGEIISNSSLYGKNYIVHFFFTSCQTICPPITANIKERIFDEIRPKEKIKNGKKVMEDQITILSVSIAEDTELNFIDYATDFNINLTKNWHFLTGSFSDVRDFASNLSLVAGHDPSIEIDGGFYHSSHVLLIDTAGFIRAGIDKKIIDQKAKGDITNENSITYPDLVKKEDKEEDKIHYTWDGSSSYEMRTLAEDIKQLNFNQNIPRKNED